MIPVEEATRIVQSNLLKTSIVEVDFSDAVGRILAEPVTVERDLPPFNRATMDGIAIYFDSLSSQHSFPIQSTQAAGEPQQTLSAENHCIEIMTGASLPVGADTVIPYEQIRIKEKIATVLQDAKFEKGQNIHRQGVDAKRGDVIIKTGAKISPAEVAVLASVGKSKVLVYEWPKIAIVSTGNELVDVTETPLNHQIRKSNSYALQAAIKSVGCMANLFHLPDDLSVLEKELSLIISEHNVIILSGGVSKGKFDFVPQVLAALGIQKHFHQVAQRPGKPFWFGSRGNTFVFGLPGNPVSTYLCFYRYILPWLWKSLHAEMPEQKAILAEPYTFHPPLNYFLQVTIKNEQGKLLAYPKTGEGSGDFANLVEVDGFLELPHDRNHFQSGEVFDFIRFR